MKKQKLKPIKFFLITLGLSWSNSFAQFVPTTPPGTISTVAANTGVGIGNFPLFTPTNARFHVNNFYCGQQTGTLNGFLFRTDGSNTVDNQWQLFTGTTAAGVTEKFKLFVPAGTSNAVFQTSQANSRMLFNANNTTRMIITDNGLANVNGRIAMGNNLPAGFNPLSRLHLHQNGANTDIRFTNSATINGFVVGNDNIGTAYANQMEAQDFYLSTSNTERMRINRNTGSNSGLHWR